MGDPRSQGTFDAVFDEYAPAVLRYARRRLDSEDAAWDVVSDTFLAVWRHWDRRPVTPDLRPWLYAIAANAVRNQWRATGRQDRLAARLSAARYAAPAPDPADGVVLRRATEEALARLSETDREVLRLIGWEGLTDARSIGLVLGLSPVAARSRVHRARRRLQALLAEPADPPAGAAEVSAPPVHPPTPAGLRVRVDLRDLQLLPDQHRVPPHAPGPARRRPHQGPGPPGPPIQLADHPDRPGPSIMIHLTAITRIMPMRGRWRRASLSDSSRLGHG